MLPPPGLITTSGAPSWPLAAEAAGGRSRVRGAARRATRVDSTAARLARRDRLGPLGLVGGPEGRGRSARLGIMACGLLSVRVQLPSSGRPTTTSEKTTQRHGTLTS